MRKSILGMLILAIVLVAQQSFGAIVAFSKTSATGTERDVPDDAVIGPRTKYTTIYFHIANLNTDDSNTFQVRRGGSVSVTLNARTDAAYGTNGVTVELCYVVADPVTYDEDNCHVVQGEALTGGGSRGRLLDVGPGRYWLNVTAGPTTGAALVSIQPHTIDR